MTRVEYETNPLRDSKSFNASQNQFDIGIYLMYTGNNETIINDNLFRYMSIQYNKVDYRIIDAKTSSNYTGGKREDFTGFEWNMTPIKAVKCEEDRFGNTSEIGFNLNLAWCPEEIDLVFQGTMANKQSNLLEAYTWVCDQDFLDENYPGEQCVPSEESLDLFHQMYALYVVKSQYFDVSEFDDTPVKSSYKIYHMRTGNHLTSQIQLELSQNFAILQDNIYSDVFSGQNVTYLTQSSSQTSIFDASYTMTHTLLTFTLNTKFEQISRRVSNFVDLLQNLGGMYGAIHALLYVLTQLIQKRIYMAELISQSIFIDDLMKISNPKEFENQPEDLAHYLNSRKAFKVSTSQLIFECLQPKRKKNFIRLAKDKLYSELNSLEYIKWVRKVNFMFDVLLSKSQRRLFVYSTQNQLNLNKVKKVGFSHEQQDKLIKSLKDVQSSKKVISKRILTSLFQKYNPIEKQNDDNSMYFEDNQVNRSDRIALKSVSEDQERQSKLQYGAKLNQRQEELFHSFQKSKIIHERSVDRSKKQQNEKSEESGSILFQQKTQKSTLKRKGKNKLGQTKSKKELRESS